MIAVSNSPRLDMMHVKASYAGLRDAAPTATMVVTLPYSLSDVGPSFATIINWPYRIPQRMFFSTEEFALALFATKLRLATARSVEEINSALGALVHWTISQLRGTKAWARAIKQINFRLFRLVSFATFQTGTRLERLAIRTASAVGLPFALKAAKPRQLIPTPDSERPAAVRAGKGDAFLKSQATAGAAHGNPINFTWLNVNDRVTVSAVFDHSPRHSGVNFNRGELHTPNMPQRTIQCNRKP
jgi:hypothetical protein